MHNYPKNSIFLDYNLRLHKMIDIYSKYDNMHKNGMFYALICINNHIIACQSCVLSIIRNIKVKNHNAPKIWLLHHCGIYSACCEAIVYKQVTKLHKLGLQKNFNYINILTKQANSWRIFVRKIT